jgi:diguanylate cyclase (GGDEF)-like protein
MLDLDEFKAVNDAFGHQAGDRLLSEIGRAIAAVARETDLVFRYGGDEFAVLLPRTDARAAMQISQRIRAAVHRVGHPGIQKSDVDITASIGVATFPEDGATGADILLAADRACFVAKRGGRDRIADAAKGLFLAAEFSLQEPTPVDSSDPRWTGAEASPDPIVEGDPSPGARPDAESGPVQRSPGPRVTTRQKTVLPVS